MLFETKKDIYSNFYPWSIEKGFGLLSYNNLDFKALLSTCVVQIKSDSLLESQKIVSILSCLGSEKQIVLQCLVLNWWVTARISIVDRPVKVGIKNLVCVVKAFESICVMRESKPTFFFHLSSSCLTQIKISTLNWTLKLHQRWFATFALVVYRVSAKKLAQLIYFNYI